MTQCEFEKLALRNDAPISYDLYNSIEKFYMSDNEYHNQVAGFNETKQEFVKRVFGGKVNTPKSIARKVAEESIRENRYLLRNTPVTDEVLSIMDFQIREHYNNIY